MGKGKGGEKSSGKGKRKEYSDKNIVEDHAADYMSTNGDDLNNSSFFADEGFDGDEVLSNKGGLNSLNSNNGVEDIKSTAFDIGEAIDMLKEKKVNLREPGLTAIINYLRSSGRSSADFDPLHDYLETLINQVKMMLRRPANVKEGTNLCIIICLLALYLGPHETILLKAYERILVVQLIDRSISNASVDDDSLNELRSIALFTFIFLVYIDENEEKILQTLDYLEQIILGLTPTDVEASPRNAGGVVFYTPELKAKAIDCWVLLASHLNDHDILERSRDNDIFETITTLLDDNSFNDVTTKVSAGRGIAFLWETAHNHNSEASDDEMAHLLCYNTRTVDDALDIIRRICSDSSKKVSKRNKKEQRAEFRDIENWITERHFPAEKIRMQGADLEVTSFGMERVVETLRFVLESGFHSSLRMYPVVKDILGVEFVTNDMDGGGSPSKTLKGSFGDKERTRYMKQDRLYRQSFLNDGYSSD